MDQVRRPPPGYREYRRARWFAVAAHCDSAAERKGDAIGMRALMQSGQVQRARGRPAHQSVAVNTAGVRNAAG
ncbi:hypothetical protein AQ611_22935 [Burkholderia singularis]|nr:hypothetical protein AQ611_22935 [Burkholderia sp. Bp7605]